MKIENLFHIILISLLTLSGCNPKASNISLTEQIYISLSDDSTAVEIHQIKPEVLDYFKSDSISEKDWKNFLSVYPETNDPEMRDLQQPLEGDYIVRDSLITFVPKHEFEKDSSYFVRVYGREVLSKPSDIIFGGKLPQKSEPLEFVFKR